MPDTRQRINSAEVADLMLKLKRPVSAPELTAMLARQYPDLLVEKNDVYIRLKGFYQSEKADCVMDDTVRPRTFHLKSIHSRYFKFRHGRKTDLRKTVIKHTKTDQQKEKAMREVMALCLKIWNASLLKRRHAGLLHR